MARIDIEFEELEQTSGVFSLKMPGAPARITARVESPFKDGWERAERRFAEELRWYLEDFLEYPLAPATDRAAKCFKTLKEWGAKAFLALTNPLTVDETASLRRSIEAGDVGIRITARTTVTLSWPWEVLSDEHLGFLAHKCRFERDFIGLPSEPENRNAASSERINILVVAPRPYSEDVAIRSTVKPLLDVIKELRIPANVELVRPATLEELRNRLSQRPHFYHLLHFDGHGSYRPGQDLLEWPETAYEDSSLAFEYASGSDSNSVSAKRLASTLRGMIPPIVLLTACRSAMLTRYDNDPMAAVAVALRGAGAQSVVAMAYAVYAVAARISFAAFYREWLSSGEVGTAVRTARHHLAEHAERDCVWGKIPLHDWIVPVLYQHGDIGSIGLPRINSPERTPDVEESLTPGAAFCGREGYFAVLERSLRMSQASVIVHGLAGVGKTRLIHEFCDWLQSTMAQDERRFVWLSPRDDGPQSLTALLQQVVETDAGDDVGSVPYLERLRVGRYLIVVDDFERISSSHDQSEQAAVFRLLLELRDSSTKLILISSSQETWLSDEVCFRIPVRGLNPSERWELAHKSFDSGGIPDRSWLAVLEDSLGGHPTAMKAVLPLADALPRDRSPYTLSFGQLPSDSGDEWARFLRPCMVATGHLQGIPMGLLSLHRGFLIEKLLHAMILRFDAYWMETQTSQFLMALESFGLVSPISPGLFELHPGLSGVSTFEATDRFRFPAIFVSVLSIAAEANINVEAVYTPLKANLYHALFLAEQLSGTFDLVSRLNGPLNASKRAELWGEEDTCGYAEMLMAEHSIDPLLRMLATIAEAEGRTADVIELTTRFKAHSALTGFEEDRKDALERLGRLAERRRDYTDAEQIYKALEKDQPPSSEDKSRIEMNLGRVAFGKDDYEAARSHFEKVTTGSERESAAIAHYYLAGIAEAECKYERAHEHGLVPIFDTTS